MYHVYLSEAEQIEIKHRLSQEQNAKVWKRLQAIYSRNERIPSQEIARHLSVSMRTIGEWVKLYLTGGLEALTTLNYDNQGPKSRLADYQDEIDALVEEEEIPTITDLQSRIEDLYGLRVEESWLSRWCKKNSIFVSRRPE